MKRKILLIEPNYKNKYPPLGLMKLSTYHKQLGDEVKFFKGDLIDLIIQDIYEELEQKLIYIDKTINWFDKKNAICQYIKTGKKSFIDIIFKDIEHNCSLILENLQYYNMYYRTKKYLKYPKYDRVCISTLFTFYWDKTIETIEFAKLIVKNTNNILVGGVMASVIPKEIKESTGITPYEGLLDKAGILDDNNYIIDQMPLDYSILDEIEYKYPESDGYYGYMTRGCKRKCAFCAVPTIEPEYKSYISLMDNIQYVNKYFGEQRNLLLLDNNVLASKEFPKIIDEIVQMGFHKGATYIEPNYLEICVQNLKSELNDKAYLQKSYNLIHSMLHKLKGQIQQQFYDSMEKYRLLNFGTVTKDNILQFYPTIETIYEKHRNKATKMRYVDFNQGVDARYLTEEKVKLLSKIPIKPLRIAFDELKLKDKYEKAIRLSAEYGIKDLSNYLLYNFEDEPKDLFYRMKINVELCEELDIRIYSFPMKYIPIFGDVSKNRNYIGKHWNKKFIRAVQAVLNSTKGKIGRGISFFEKAFGKNEEEFMKILYMPEAYIIYRLKYECNGNTDEWYDLFSSLTSVEKDLVLPIIEANEFKNVSIGLSPKLQRLIEHYLTKRT
ncbi:MAG: hypothetical protein AB1389_03120 [Campylobacterota bacterium]